MPTAFRYRPGETARANRSVGRPAGGDVYPKYAPIPMYFSGTDDAPIINSGPRKKGGASLTRASYIGLGIGGGCGFAPGHSALAAVSFYPIVGSRQVLVLDVMFGGGFGLSYRWFALGFGFGRSAFAVVSSYR